MRRLADYPEVRDWLMGTKICSYKYLEAFFDDYGVKPGSIIRELAREFIDTYCKGGEPPKPFRHRFKSRSSKASVIGIDKLGRRFAVNRKTGYRISTKPYRRFFPK